MAAASFVRIVFFTRVTASDVFVTPVDIFVSPGDIFVNPDDVFVNPDDIFVNPGDVLGSKFRLTLVLKTFIRSPLNFC